MTNLNNVYYIDDFFGLPNTDEDEYSWTGTTLKCLIVLWSLILTIELT